MKRVLFLNIHVTYIILYCLCILTGCTSAKKIVYFQDISGNRNDSILKSMRYLIENGDIIQISITSSEPNDYSHFSKSGFKISADQSEANAYLVDSSGSIDLPFIGSIEVKGKTKDQIKIELKEKLKPYLAYPTVNIRIINLRITLLGDVAKPGTYALNESSITLPEALGLAGDLNIGARRDNILIIGKVNGKRTYKRVDLRSNSILESKNYYLQTGDVIYVEPSKTKIAQNDTRRWQTMTFAATALSLLTIILLRL